MRYIENSVPLERVESLLHEARLLVLSNVVIRDLA